MLGLWNGGPGTVILNVSGRGYTESGPFTWVSHNVPVTSISVWGKQADCNGDIPIYIQDANGYWITPTTSGEPWFEFEVSARPARQVYLSYSRHPDCNGSLSMAQERFFTCSQELAKDWDACLTDEQITTQSQFENDSVPVYVDFHVGNAANSTFPTGWRDFDFTDPKYNVINNPDDYVDLKENGDFADVQHVTSLPFGILGNGAFGRILIMISAGAVAYAHEWAHTQGATHFYQDGVTPLGSEFLMFNGFVSNWKVARPQRNQLQ